MEVTVAYRHRGSPEEHGTWGNDTVSDLLGKWPTLVPLVAELKAEMRWSAPAGPEEKEWTALFFEDYLAGVHEKLFLEFVPSCKSIRVLSMPIDEKHPPTLHDVERWIIANTRRAK